MKKGAILFLSLCLVLALSACSTSQEKTTVPPTDTTTTPPESSTAQTTVPPTIPTTEPSTVLPTSSSEEDTIIIKNLSFPNPNNYVMEVSDDIYTVTLSDRALSRSFFDVYCDEAGSLEGDMLDALVYLGQKQFEEALKEEIEDITDEESVNIEIAGFDAEGISVYFQNKTGFCMIVSFTDGEYVYTINYFAKCMNSTKTTENISIFNDFIKTAEYTRG